jgi:hypothetical protein
VKRIMKRIKIEVVENGQVVAVFWTTDKAPVGEKVYV